MKKSSRMNTVLQVTSADEEKAASLFKESNFRLQAEQQKLEQLENYQEDYQQQVRQNCQVSVRQLQQVSAFMGRLHEAIAQQKNQVIAVTEHRETLRVNWVSARGRTLSITQLKASYLDEERRWEDKKEQKEMDELINNKVNRDRNRNR